MNRRAAEAYAFRVNYRIPWIGFERPDWSAADSHVFNCTTPLSARISAGRASALHDSHDGSCPLTTTDPVPMATAFSRMIMRRAALVGSQFWLSSIDPSISRIKG